MKKERLLLIRYGAFGDWLYTVPILPYLFEKYDVILECSLKVGLLVHNDPRYTAIEAWDWAGALPKEILDKGRKAIIDACGPLFEKRHKKLIDKYKPDKIINLNGSIETQCIPEVFQEEFNWDLKKRQDKYSHITFYDAVFQRAGIAIPEHPKLDELYYSEQELNWGINWRLKNKDRFIIVLAIAGSTFPKVFHNYKEYIDLVLTKYPDVDFYIVGDESMIDFIPKHPRIKNACIDVPIKQIMLMTGFADYVIGPETGAIVAAGMWGTPKTMMCTMSSVEQCTKYQNNDFSIQSPLACSPCLRAVYSAEDCYDVRFNDSTRMQYAACSKSFEVEKLVSILDQVRKKYREGTLVPHLPSKYLSYKGG